MKASCSQQLPFHTTLLGVVKGVLEHFGSTVSGPYLFGATGHAFLINIHEQISPSGPYCWNQDPFHELLAGLGVRRTSLGFFHGNPSPEERARIESEVRSALEAGTPASLLNLEHQLICGWDDDGFDLVQPWAPRVDFPAARLTCGSWSEFGNQIHVEFSTYTPIAAWPKLEQIRRSLETAVDMAENPTRYALHPYAIGPDAFRDWLAAIEEHGASHGNWWNAQVWGECRRMAAGYLAEVAESAPAAAEPALAASELARQVAVLLAQAGSKERSLQEKAESLREASEVEQAMVERLRETLRLLG